MNTQNTTKFYIRKIRYKTINVLVIQALVNKVKHIKSDVCVTTHGKLCLLILLNHPNICNNRRLIPWPTLYSIE